MMKDVAFKTRSGYKSLLERTAGVLTLRHYEAEVSQESGRDEAVEEGV